MHSVNRSWQLKSYGIAVLASALAVLFSLVPVSDLMPVEMVRYR